MAIFECCILMPSFDDQIFRSFPLIFLQSVWFLFCFPDSSSGLKTLSWLRLLFSILMEAQKRWLLASCLQAQSPQPLVTFFSLQFCPKERKKDLHQGSNEICKNSSLLSFLPFCHPKLSWLPFFSLSLCIVNKKTIAEHKCRLVHLYECRHLDIP